MACLEHECRECKRVWFDNNPSRVCPSCGSLDTAMYFDEQDDGEYPLGYSNEDEEEEE